MNNLKIKIYKKVLQEVPEKYDGADKEKPGKYDGAEDIINSRIEEICSHKKFSAEDVIYFLFSC